MKDLLDLDRSDLKGRGKKRGAKEPSCNNNDIYIQKLVTGTSSNYLTFDSMYITVPLKHIVAFPPDVEWWVERTKVTDNTPKTTIEPVKVKGDANPHCVIDTSANNLNLSFSSKVLPGHALISNQNINEAIASALSSFGMSADIDNLIQDAVLYRIDVTDDVQLTCSPSHAICALAKLRLRGRWIPRVYNQSSIVYSTGQRGRRIIIYDKMVQSGDQTSRFHNVLRIESNYLNFEQMRSAFGMPAGQPPKLIDALNSGRSINAEILSNMYDHGVIIPENSTAHNFVLPVTIPAEKEFLCASPDLRRHRLSAF